MDGIAAVLPFAVGVAVSPIPIIAVILMLFSSRAKVNGPMFALGWAVALAVVSGIAFVAGDIGQHDHRGGLLVTGGDRRSRPGPGRPHLEDAPGDWGAA